MIHPAHAIPFDDLVRGLQEARDAKLVSEKAAGDFRLYCYTQKAVYDRQWSDITLAARGLILDLNQRRIAATPFQKFFNAGERGDPIPDEPFEVSEKLDGSLIIIWHDDACWRCCTKGSFDSIQARAAADLLAHRHLGALVPGVTYLAEYVAPTNRIVVRYPTEELVFLAAYDAEGVELPGAGVRDVAMSLGWRWARPRAFASIEDMLVRADDLAADEEGFVVRFSGGLRLKIKGAEYRRIHALISRCTPLAVWEAMAAGDSMDMMRRQLPEEFWSDFDAITALLAMRSDDLIRDVRGAAVPIAGWSDKDVGLRLREFPEHVRPFVFAYRKSGGDLLIGKPRAALFRAIRPTGNVLPGYEPSYAMNRVIEESL